MVLKVNLSEKRQRHLLDRMILRGVSREELLQAIQRGTKRRQRERLYESRYRYFSVVYEEITDPRGRWRKIYPITVKVTP